MRSVWAGVCTSRVFQVLLGKTATVREVIRTLRKKSRDGSLPRFNHVELASPFADTQARVSAIAEELMGESARRRRLRTMSWIGDSRRAGAATGASPVLVIDEMDPRDPHATVAVQPVRLAHSPCRETGDSRHRQHPRPTRRLLPKIPDRALEATEFRSSHTLRTS